MGAHSAARSTRTSTTRRERGRHRAKIQRMPAPNPWLGAGAVSLGIGAAAFAGSSVAHADDTGSDSASSTSASGSESASERASSTTQASATRTGAEDSSSHRRSRGATDKPTAKTGDGRSAVTTGPRTRRPTAGLPTHSTGDAGAANRSDESAESDRDTAGESDALEPAPTERVSTTVTTATTDQRRVRGANASLATTANSRGSGPSGESTALDAGPDQISVPQASIAVAPKNHDTSAASTESQPAGAFLSNSRGSTTRSGEAIPVESRAATQATQQRVVPAAAADVTASPFHVWLQRTFFNKTPTVSFVPGQTTTLSNGKIRGVIDGDDADSDVLVYTAGKPTKGGTVEISSDGTFVYTPGPGFASDGSDTFSVTVSDEAKENGWHTHGLLGLLIPGLGATATTNVSVGGNLTTAAERYGWGTPSTTVFSGPSALLNGWALYNSPGHAGYGRRTPAAISFANNAMIITGDGAGNTGGLAWLPGQKYGAWEVRVRVPEGAADYHPVVLLWPDAENWPVGGEIDFLEITNNASRQRVGHFLHYSAQNRTESAVTPVDATQWHNYAVSWTPQAISVYIDGAPVFTTTDTSHFPPGPMHLAIQLDASEKRPINLTGGAQMMVAWARRYTLSQIT